MPLRFEKVFTGADASRKGREGEARDRMSLALGKAVQAQLTRRRDAAGRWMSERGALAVGVPLTLPERGVVATIAVPQLDAEFWRAALVPQNGTTAAAPAQRDSLAAAFVPDRVELRTDELQVFGRRFHEVDLKAQNAAQVWQVRLAAKEANGELQFDPFGRGALRARLKNLALEAPGEAGSKPATTSTALDELPALDVVAENFSLGAKKLGRLEVQARNEAAAWRIEKLAIANPDGRLDGRGSWRMQEPRQFFLDFRLDAEDVGNLLDRLGFPGTVKRGTATLAGKLSWGGVPVRIDYPSLTGELQVDVSRGQFARLDPGAGKLLGLISLQSLPRRITLDFRDVFSEGFAFDSISGRMDVRAGIMRTERLQIDGPSARVVMKGEVDLENETQKMVVNVQPELGGTAALGVALAHPVAGVVTLLAHKVLQNPLNQIFSFDYSVTGSWSDPKVEKIATQRLGTPGGTTGEQGESGK